MLENEAGERAGAGDATDPGAVWIFVFPLPLLAQAIVNDQHGGPLAVRIERGDYGTAAQSVEVATVGTTPTGTGDWTLADGVNSLDVLGLGEGGEVVSNSFHGGKVAVAGGIVNKKISGTALVAVHIY